MKTFKVTVIIPEGYDDIQRMDITIQAHGDLKAMRSIHKAMSQLGIMTYDLQMEPIEYQIRDGQLPIFDKKCGLCGNLLKDCHFACKETYSNER